MELKVIPVEIKCINDEPHVFVVETGEKLEVAFGNFDNGIFVKYQGEEYLIDTDYPCWAGGNGVLRLRGTTERSPW